MTEWVQAGSDISFRSSRGNRQGDLWLLTIDLKLVQFAKGQIVDPQLPGPVCDFAVRDNLYFILGCDPASDHNKICARSLNIGVPNLVCRQFRPGSMPIQIAATDTHLFFFSKAGNMYSGLLPLEWDSGFFGTFVLKPNTKYLTAPLDENIPVIINNDGDMEINVCNDPSSFCFRPQTPAFPVKSISISQNIIYVSDSFNNTWWNGAGRGWNLLHGSSDLISAYGTSGLAAIRRGKLYTRRITIPNPENPDMTAWVGQEGNYKYAQGNRQGDLWLVTPDNKLASFSSGFAADNQPAKPICGLAVRDKVYFILGCDQRSQICARSLNAAVLGHLCIKLDPSIVPTQISASDSNLFLASENGRLWSTKLPLTADSVFFDTYFTLTSNMNSLTVPLDDHIPVIINDNGVIQSDFCTSDIFCFDPPPKLGPSFPLTSISISQNVTYVTDSTRKIWWRASGGPWHQIDGEGYEVSAYGKNGLAVISRESKLFTQNITIQNPGDLTTAAWVPAAIGVSFRFSRGNRQGDLWLLTNDFRLVQFSHGQIIDPEISGPVYEFAVRDKLYFIRKSFDDREICSRSLNISVSDLVCNALVRSASPLRIAATDSQLFFISQYGSMYSTLLPLVPDSVSTNLFSGFFETGVSRSGAKYLTAPLDQNMLGIINDGGYIERISCNDHTVCLQPRYPDWLSSIAISKNVTYATDSNRVAWWTAPGRVDVVSAFGASGLAALLKGKLYTLSVTDEIFENPYVTAWVSQVGNYQYAGGNRQGDLWLVTADNKLVSFTSGLPADNQTSRPICGLAVRDKVYFLLGCDQMSEVCARSLNASVQGHLCIKVDSTIVPTRIAASDSGLYLTTNNGRIWSTRLPLTLDSIFFDTYYASGPFIRFLTVPLDDNNPAIINNNGFIETHLCSSRDIHCLPSRPTVSMFPSIPISSFSISQNIVYITDKENFIWWRRIEDNSLLWELTDGFAQGISAFGADGLATLESGKLYTRTFTIGSSGDPLTTPWVAQQSNKTFEKVEGNRQGDLWLLSGNDLFVFQPAFPLDTLTKGLVLDFAVRDKVYILSDVQVCSRPLNITVEDLLCIKPDFLPYKISSSDSTLFVVTFDGVLYSTKLPLTRDSTFFNTGVLSPHAKSLSVPLDGTSPVILDLNGNIQFDICSRAEVNCFAPSVPPPPSPAFPLTSVSISRNITYTTDSQSNIWWRFGDKPWHKSEGRVMTPWAYFGEISGFTSRGNRYGNLWLRGPTGLWQAFPALLKNGPKFGDMYLYDFVLRDKIYIHGLQKMESWQNYENQLCASALDTPFTHYDCATPFFHPKAISVSDSNFFVLADDGALYSTVLPFTTTPVFFDTGFRSSNALFLTVPLDENSPVILDALGNMQRDFCIADGVNCISPPSAPAFPLTSISISRNITFVTDSRRHIWWRSGNGPWHLTDGLGERSSSAANFNSFLGWAITAYGNTGLAVAGRLQTDEDIKRATVFIRTLSFQNSGEPDMTTWQPFSVFGDVTKLFGDRNGNIWAMTRDGHLSKGGNINIEFVADFAIKVEHVFYLRGHQLCSISLDGSDLHCTTPDFTPVKIAVSDSNLFVLSDKGTLYSSILPLTWKSVFFDTGFQSPNARFLTVPLDENSPVILDSADEIRRDFCVESAGVHCFSSSSPQPPPVEPIVNDCAVLSGIFPAVKIPDEPFTCCGFSFLTPWNRNAIAIKCNSDGRIDFL
ncbi:hypothetical protein HDU97_007023 [Phlyctochytrium planicorne]|nr:hypothetical protein HDU97_007023 [Phlyctochytrium planicorne]